VDNPARAAKLGGRAEAVFEEATLTASAPTEPHGPRRCGGPEHPQGFQTVDRYRDAASHPCARLRSVSVQTL